MKTSRDTNLWRHQDFLKLWAGQTISQLGSTITWRAIPMAAVLTLAATPSQMGLLAATGIAPVLLVGLLAGVWVDRLRRRPVMVSADVGRALLLLTIPVAALFGSLSMPQLYIVAALTGVLTVFFDVANQSYLPTLVRRKHIVEANSRMSASGSAASVTGTGIGGLLVQALSAPLAIIFDAVSFVLSALCIGLIRHPELPPPGREHRQSVWLEVSTGLKSVLGNPLLRALTLSSAMRDFFGGFFATLYDLYAIRELGITPAILGLLIAAGSASSFIGALIARRVARHLGIGPTLIASATLWSGVDILVPLAAGPVIVATAMMLAAQLADVAYEVYAINEVSLRQTIIPDHLLGRANASAHFVVAGAVPLGALLGGVLAEQLGMRTTLLIAVVGMMLATAWLVFSPIRTLTEQPQMPTHDEN